MPKDNYLRVFLTFKTWPLAVNRATQFYLSFNMGILMALLKICKVIFMNLINSPVRLVLGMIRTLPVININSLFL